MLYGKNYILTKYIHTERSYWTFRSLFIITFTLSHIKIIPKNVLTTVAKYCIIVLLMI
jgi:hypothetical protein